MNVRDLAARVQQPGRIGPGSGTSPERPSAPQGDSFAETLRRMTEPRSPSLAISAHAAERLEQRGIPLTDADHAQMDAAIRALEEKGAQDALLLRDDAAFIVNVPNRTLVTALGQADLQDRVFTGIDSAFVL